MSASRTFATARRTLEQLRHDRRTVGMTILLPSLLVVLLRYVLDEQRTFDRVAPALLCIFPFVVMFLIASVGTLRERTTGTLERLMTMPIGKLDLLAGYALALGLLAVAQVGVVAAIALTWLGLGVSGSVVLLIVIAVLDALLGMALGLLVSAFARTEFQAVQFMPLFALPQVLLCGLFVPRDQMAAVLGRLSDVMPLSYAVDAMTLVTTSAAAGAQLGRDIAIVAGCVLLSLLLGAATLRRRTP
ncbi:MAG: ABC transporter permease [Chloroflexi bacterium]|nr:MAG: ABC transporter permease [Chloroflexota bacterium]